MENRSVVIRKLWEALSAKGQKRKLGDRGIVLIGSGLMDTVHLSTELYTIENDFYYE